jgi:nitroreductase
MLAQGQIRSLLGIPEEVRIAAMIPMGWPDRAFGLVKRKPIDEVTHWERW